MVVDRAASTGSKRVQARGDGSISLADCLRHFTAVETLSEKVVRGRKIEYHKYDFVCDFYTGIFYPQYKRDEKEQTLRLIAYILYIFCV